jgi:hypothetical protein
MDRVEVAQNMIQWQTLVNTAMKVSVPQNARNFLAT